MTDAVALPRFSLGEEIANAVTHGVGIVLAIAGLVVLSAFAALYGDAAHVVGGAVFGAALVACYLAMAAAADCLDPSRYARAGVHRRRR